MIHSENQGEKQVTWPKIVRTLEHLIESKPKCPCAKEVKINSKHNSFNSIVCENSQNNRKKKTCKHKGYLEHHEYVTRYLSQNLNYIVRTNIKRFKIKSQCIHEGRNIMMPPQDPS